MKGKIFLRTLALFEPWCHDLSLIDSTKRHPARKIMASTALTFLQRVIYMKKRQDAAMQSSFVTCKCASPRVYGSLSQCHSLALESNAKQKTVSRKLVCLNYDRTYGNAFWCCIEKWLGYFWSLSPALWEKVTCSENYLLVSGLCLCTMMDAVFSFCHDWNTFSGGISSFPVN